MLTNRSPLAQSAFLGAFLPAQRAFGWHHPVLLRLGPYWPQLLRAGWSHLFGMNDLSTEIMTPEQVADLLHIPPRTIEEWRRTRSGPPWRRVGRHVRYLRREVLAWFEELDSDG
ncbi:helix-turn-helix domain-containing protein [Humibacter ginsenosidimutans]|nr:helix-turn-helix domain-containing protein [Humibacter ginsenosidimutans]